MKKHVSKKGLLKFCR